MLKRARTAIYAGALLVLAGNGSAQERDAGDGLTVISIDHVRTERANGESRHEIMPVAVFDGGQLLSVSEWSNAFADRTRRQELLGAHSSVQVLYRGRPIGTLEVSEIALQQLHCTQVPVGRGDFEPAGPQPENEISESTIQYFMALSGALDTVRRDGDPFVVTVTDPAEIERSVLDVQTVAPRLDLLPLDDDETRAYRLDGYDAVVVVRKRRSRRMVPFPPVEGGLPSPLMTDIVVVRTRAGERSVHPVWISERGTDSWGKGPEDYFIDAFELGDGMAYLAFRRRDYEANYVRLYRLTQSGSAALVFQDDLYGC